MAPAPTATANRPMAKPSKIRYFKGKAPDAARSDSDSEEEEEEQIKPVRRQEQITIDKTVVAGGAGRVVDYGSAKKGKGSDEPKMKVQLRDVKVEGGRVVLPKAANGEESSEYETDEEEEPQAKPKSGVPLPPAGDESSEYETDSEEESEEEVKKPAFRPVFVKKDARNMTQERLQAEAEAKLKEQEEIEIQRKIDSKELAGETIRRELAEREAIEVVPDVDDTDGLDLAGEFDAWRARELGRLLRDKQAQAALDEEKEEIERRRAMPEAERLKEDMEYAQKTREKEKGQMGFLQKYYHKGAFHQDDELLARDYTGATDSAVDMSLLPKVMQVRDFGKASRTKYTHLVDQDTSAGGWGTAARTGPGGQNGQFAQGCFNCGGPHLRKDCPNNNPNEVNNGMGTSANNSSLGMGGPSRQERFGGDRGNRYREEGRERRFDESRAEQSRDAGYSGGRDRDGGRDRSERRDGESDKKRRRSRSRSRDYEKDRRRGDDRRRDDRDRDRDRRR